MVLSPGRIPEAAALERLTEELFRLRATIVRESIGVDSPDRKLGAIAQVIDEHSRRILQTMHAARTRHGGALAADDGVRLAASILVNTTLTTDWLQVASDFKRLPSGPPDHRQLSPARSQAERERRLAIVKARTGVAIEMIDDLRRTALADPGIRDTHGALAFLRSLRIQLRCNEITATVLARGAVGRTHHLPANALADFRHELEGISSSEAFDNERQSARSAVLNTLALVCSVLGDRTGTASALKRRRELPAGSVEDQIRSVIDLLGFSTSDAERLLLIGELEQIARQGRLGTVYSRERLGRISMLSDTFAAVAVLADPGTAVGRSLSKASFDCHSLWMFGSAPPDDGSIIRVAVAWSGSGKVFWRETDEPTSLGFELDPPLVGQLLQARDSMSTNATLWRRVLTHQDQALGPAMAEAFSHMPGAPIEAIGLAALLPLSLLSIKGVAIGLDPAFAYVHPRGGNYDRVHGHTRWEPNLVIVDHAFGDEARRVVDAARSLEAECSRPISIIEFDSTGGEPLSRRQLLGALMTATDVILYCHGVSPMERAPSVGLLLGDGDTLTVDEIVALELSHINGLALIACSSGRGNPFVGQVTVAHAMALAGVSTVGFTYWPIRQERGATVAEALLDENQRGASLNAIVAGLTNPVDPALAAFSIIQM